MKYTRQVIEDITFPVFQILNIYSCNTTKNLKWICYLTRIIFSVQLDSEMSRESVNKRKNIYYLLS